MISPLHAVEDALARTRATLFEPFDAKRYFLLGFCMWLYQLGSARGNGPGGSAGGSWRGDEPAPSVDLDQLQQVLDGLQAAAPMIAGALALGLLIGLLVWSVLLFLQTRGAFLVMDGLVRQRGAVAEPWAEYAPEAWALFRFRLLLGIGAMVGVLGTLGLTGATVWSTWSPTDGVTGVAVAVLVVGGLVAGLLALLLGLADAVADDLVVPLMYARRIGVGEGFSQVWGFVREAPGAFALYVVLRVVLGLGAGVATALLTCLSCGLAMVPLLGTLILLPVLVVVRNLSISFVAQLSEDLAEALTPTSGPTPG